MRNPAIPIKNSKLRGEWAELRFMARAAEHGLMASKPWGDSAPYDVLVERHGRVRRVQIKCTCKQRLQSYVCSVSNRRGPYTSDQIDFIAAYIVPADTWYIVPVAALPRSFDIWLSPHRPNSRYGLYKEAWHLLL
jgi:PD-(D/E)XK endonuclease